MSTSPEIPIGRFFAVVAAAVISLLLAGFSPARSAAAAGEPLAPVAEGTAPVEEAPAVESAAAPPVEEVQVPSPAPASVPAPAAEVSSVATESPAATAVAPVARGATNAVEEEVDRVDTVAKEVTTAVDGAMPSGGNQDPEPIVHEVVKRQAAAKQVSQVAAADRGSSDHGVPAAVETQPPAAGVGAGPDRDSSNNQTPGFLTPLSPGALTGPPGESLRLLATGNPIGLPTVLALGAGSTSTHSSSGSAARHPANRAPFHGPRPSPSSSGEATSAPGGSSFVPLAPLLALLALVAPAILRRFREVPDLPAPALFVCALERPG
jgi:hypothetical protein